MAHANEASANAGGTSRPIWEGLTGQDGDGPYLKGGRCRACGFTTLAVREICPECWATGAMDGVPIGRSGILYTYTVIHALPAGFDEPYAVGYVDTDDGVRVFAHVALDPDIQPIGRRVQLEVVALRRDEDGTMVQGPRYRPIDAKER